MKGIFKTCFFASLTVILINCGGLCLKCPEIVYKIGGVALIFLGVLSAGAVLHCLGLYNNK